jgi:ligand-binding SRPBCC domain-containing protein
LLSVFRTRRLSFPKFAELFRTIENQKVLMPGILISTFVPQQLETVRDGFNEQLFQKLTPPFIHSSIVEFGGCRKGDRVVLKVGLPGLTQIWESLITAEGSSDDLWFFVDEGIRLPFPLKRWQHKHLVKKAEEGSVIVDDIIYSTGFVLSDYLVYPFLWFMFYWRKPVYKRYFA